jgi:hypothetical protein
MHTLHEAYLNLKGAERIDYCSYLAQCANLSKLPKSTAMTTGYAKYAKSLLDYCVSFLRRTQPLMPLSALLKAAEEDFDGRWQRGEVNRWQQAAQAEGEGTNEQVDLGAYSSAQELGTRRPYILKYPAKRQMPTYRSRGAPHSSLHSLILLPTTCAEVVGPDRLKAQLAKLGLKCGGSLTQRAER